jgi:hypothetical protein
MDIDPFLFFRWGLSLVVTVYATVLTVQSLWGWWVWLAGSDRYMSLLRQYVTLHGLRLRLTSFFGDLVVCVLLCVAFLLMWQAHGEINQLGEAIRQARHAIGQS